KHVKCAVFFHTFNIFQAVDTFADCLEVCKCSSQPALVNVVHAGSCCFVTNRFLGLFFSSYKKNCTAICSKVFHKVVCFINFLHSLLQVDDMNAVSLRENVFFHFRVPAACLVSTMHTSF